jgi:hypothetical protein
MKFVIPTYDRSDRFETLKFLKDNNISLDDIYIFLANEEEKMKYINSFGDDYNFIIGVLGLSNQRNFMSNYFDEDEILVYMDDDIENITHKEDKSFIEWIKECISYLESCDCGLLSVSPSVNPFFFNNNNSASFKKGNYYAIGAFYICKNDRNITLSENIILEDWERSIKYLLKYGSTIRYNDVLLKTKYFGKGGLSNARTRENYINSINQLLYLYNPILKYNYKSLPLDKHTIFPNLKFRNYAEITDVIQLPKIAPSELNCLYGMLESIYITKRGIQSNRRGFPIGHRSVTFGYVKGRYNGIYDLSNYTKKYPDIYDELLRIGNIYCPFKFTSIHINKNVVCPKHYDSKNVGNSMLLSFGDYTGCEIVINGKKYNADCNPVIFNGAMLEHYNTDDLIGTKYSLVYFSSKK